MEPNQTSGPGTSGPHWPPQTNSRSLSDTGINVFDFIKNLVFLSFRLCICKIYLMAGIFFVLENQSYQCPAPLFIFFHFSWEHTSQIKALFVQTVNKKSSALTQLEKWLLSPSMLSSMPVKRERRGFKSNQSTCCVTQWKVDIRCIFKVSDAWGKCEKISEIKNTSIFFLQGLATLSIKTIAT